MKILESMKIRDQRMIKVLGHIGRQPLQNVIPTDSYKNPTASFHTVKADNRYFGGQQYLSPSRAQLLPNNIGITLAHGDLYLRKIPVTGEEEGPVQIGTREMGDKLCPNVRQAL